MRNIKLSTIAPIISNPAPSKLPSFMNLSLLNLCLSGSNGSPSSWTTISTSDKVLLKETSNQPSSSGKAN